MRAADEQRAAVRELLTNKDMLSKFIQQQHPELFAVAQGQQLPQGIDPNDIATVGQVQQYMQQAQAELQQRAEQMQSAMNNKVSEITAEIEDRQATAKLSQEVSSTIEGLFKAHSQIVDVIPDAEQMLRWQVLQMKPQTAADTIDAIKTVFGGWKEKFDSAVTNANKKAVINKQKLVAGNIQPPGGAAPQQTPATATPKTPKGDIDWAVLRKRAEGMLS
jgi:hypothetical protein